MPPEQEDLNRQLEALQRYVSGVQQQRERAKAAAAQPPPASEPKPRPPLSWLLVTGLLVAVALAGGVVVGAVVWSTDRPAGAKMGVAGVSSATQRPDSTVSPVASPACKTAVDRANTMLAITVELQQELAEYRRVMGDPANRTLLVREVVEQTAPSRQAGASELARFDRALADYRQIVDQCQLRTPEPSG